MPKPKRGRNWATRQTEEFKQYLLEKATLNEETGEILFKDIYVSMYLTIGWKSNSIAVPYSHLVWFLKHKRWPDPDLHLDHINEKSFDNRPDNLQEITKDKNAAKRRGKGNKEYGTNKYGHGISIYYNKKDKRYQAQRYFSSKDVLELKDRRIFLFQASTLEEIELKIKNYIENGFEIPTLDLDTLFE